MNPSLVTANTIMGKLRQAGYKALLAGGCVRDQLLGRDPKDYDVATSALPEQVQVLFPRTEAVGAQFGVILVIEDGRAFEVATFRTDLSYKDGRRPESVRFSTPQEDAARRDFTINGMFLDPLSGEILDFVGGREDLKAGIIRCIGEPRQRFEEDKLRILRAARFSAELGFKLEEQTSRAIQEFTGQIKQVSWERLGIEMNKLLLCTGRRRGVELLDELGLLKELIPELLAGKGCTQPPEYHPEGDVWIHTMILLDKLENPSLELAWAGLLHDIAKPVTWSQAPGDRIRFNKHETAGADMARVICQRFRFSSQSVDRVGNLIADHLRINHVESMRVSTLKRLFRLEYFPDLLSLQKADCQASHNNLKLYEFCLAKLAEFEKLGAEQALKPKPLFTGEDLIRMGYKPGPSFKEILTAVETEQLEGRLTDKAKAEEFVKEQFSAGAQA